MPKINYGIDAPHVIRNLIIIGVLLLVVAFLLPVIIPFELKFPVNSIFLITALIVLCEGGFMLLYSLKGKFRHRDRMLRMHEWKGDENVLDIGTGLGLLMIGAARKLTTGKSVGIDIWDNHDLSNNTLQQAKQNIIAENVDDRAEILTGNILKTEFSDESFDVVMSNLCLHNIEGKQQREKACNEIFRILKKDGIAIISDFKHIKEYIAAFGKLGMRVEKTRTYYWDTFPPLTIIKASRHFI